MRARALPPPQDHAAVIIARATYTQQYKAAAAQKFFNDILRKVQTHTHIDGFSAHKNTESICHKMASGRTARALGWSTFIYIYEENLCVMRDGNSIFMCMRNNIFMITVYTCVCVYINNNIYSIRCLYIRNMKISAKTDQLVALYIFYL